MNIRTTFKPSPPKCCYSKIPRGGVFTLHPGGTHYIKVEHACGYSSTYGYVDLDLGRFYDRCSDSKLQVIPEPNLAIAGERA